MKQLIERRVNEEIIKRLIEGQKLNDFYVRRLLTGDTYNYLKCRILRDPKGKNVYPTEEELVNKIIDEVIKTKNAESIYFIALKEESYVDSLSEEILKTEDYINIKIFTSNVKNLPIEKFFDIVVKSNNAYYIASVISNIAENNSEKEINQERIKWIEKLIDKIADLYDIEALLSLLGDNTSKNIPINSLVEAVLRIANAESIYEFSELNSLYLEKTHLEKLADGVIKERNEEYAYKFAVEHPNIKTKELAKIVIDSGNDKFIFKFAKDVKNAPIKELTEAMLKSKNPDNICLFARYIDITGYINKLADRVIELGSIKYIFKFATVVKNAPIEKLADIIIQSGSLYYIKLFAQQVENAPIEKLADATIILGDPENIYFFAYTVKDAPVDKMFEAINKKSDNE